jgi:hypothetical protein
MGGGEGGCGGGADGRGGGVRVAQPARKASENINGARRA